MDHCRADRHGTGAGDGVGRDDPGEPVAIPAALQELFASWSETDLDWCLLRPAATLGHREGDIDLLVDPSQLAQARELAGHHGFAALPVDRDLHAARYDEQTDRFLWLHVQDRLRLGGGEIPAVAVLETVERSAPVSSSGLPQPRNDWLLWIVLLHDVIDKGRVPERHRSWLAALAHAGGHECPSPLEAIAFAHDLDLVRLLALLRAGRWDALGMAVPRPARTRATRAVGPRLREIWAWRGPAVAIMGPDGAGKTTLVEGLRATLPFPTRVIYMGLTGGRLPHADALRFPGLVLATRLALLWARYGLGLYHRARGRIVLFDRYTLDGWVPSGRTLGRLARLSRRLQARAVPAPDLVLLLDAPGAVMYSRKGEYDAEQLERWREAYARLVAVAPVAVIDARQPPDAVRRRAAARIWTCYAARWGSQGLRGARQTVGTPTR